MKLSNKHITGIILSGGKSKRMGTDKALINYKGQSFLHHAYNTLAALTSEIIIVSNKQSHEIAKTKRIPDIIENSGPLAGLYSGLMASTTEYNLVLSCDTPLITTAILNQLINKHHPSNDCTIFSLNDRKMPLVGLYKKTCIPKCKQLLDTGDLKLMSLFNLIQFETLEVNQENHSLFINVNSKDDLNKIM